MKKLDVVFDWSGLSARISRGVRVAKAVQAVLVMEIPTVSEKAVVLSGSRLTGDWQGEVGP